MIRANRFARIALRIARGSFYRGWFRKGVAVPTGVPWGGVWGRVQVGGGGWVFLLKKKGKGEGGGEGGGWDGDRQRNR